MNPTHPLYGALYGGVPQQQYQQPQIPQRANPLMQMGQMMAAMRNPVAFIRQNLPGIPEQAFNDPTGNSVLQYMMQNMGVTQNDIQKAAGQNLGI